MVLIKDILICVFCFVSISAYTQNWNKTANIDTLFGNNNRPFYMLNRDNGEKLYLFRDTTGKIYRTMFSCMKNGKEHRQIKEFYGNGYLKREYFYIGNTEADSTSTFYEGGNIESKEFYANGKLNGKAFAYYFNGKVETEFYYKRGKLLSVKYFDMNGNPLNNGDFNNGNGTLILYNNGIRVGICKYKRGRRKSCICNK